MLLVAAVVWWALATGGMRWVLLLVGGLCLLAAWAHGEDFLRAVSPNLLRSDHEGAVARQGATMSLMVTLMALLGLLICAVGFIILSRLDAIEAHLGIR